MKIQIGPALAFLAFAPVAATAQTQEERQACMNDAFNVWGAAFPIVTGRCLPGAQTSTPFRLAAGP